MGKLLIVYPNGLEFIEEYPDREPELQRLQVLVGGYIEHLAVTYDAARRSAYVNEEARLPVRSSVRALVGGAVVVSDVSPNQRASIIAGRRILGPMVIDLGRSK